MEGNDLALSEASVGGETKGPNLKIWLARLLSLMNPALGYIYCGLVIHFFIISFLNIGLVFLCGLTGALSSFYVLVGLILWELSLRIFAIIDVGRQARKINNEVSGSRMHWCWKWLIGGSLITLLFLVDFKTLTGFQTFIIPSTANEPTLFVGDRLVADMRYYQKKSPSYGDMVVFTGEDGLPYCFRVVGLPGDRIQLDSGKLVINSSDAPIKFIKDTISEPMLTVSRYIETLPDRTTHPIYMQRIKFPGAMVSTNEIELPKDYFYLMGDNRDNAMDSRYRGLIHRSEIIGKVYICLLERTN